MPVHAANWRQEQKFAGAPLKRIPNDRLRGHGRARCEPTTQRRMVAQAQNLFDRLCRRVEEQAVTAVGQVIGIAALRRADDRQSGRHRLKNDAAKALEPARVRAVEKAIDGPQEGHAVLCARGQQLDIGRSGQAARKAGPPHDAAPAARGGELPVEFRIVIVVLCRVVAAQASYGERPLLGTICTYKRRQFDRALE